MRGGYGSGMVSDYIHAGWPPGGEGRRGLVLDPEQIELLERIGKLTSRAQQILDRLLGRARKGSGVEGPDTKPVLAAGGADAVGEGTGGSEPVDRKDVRSLLERGLMFTGECPACEHWMSWAIPFGVMVNDSALIRMVRDNGLASSAGTFKSWPLLRPAAARAPDTGSQPDNPTITFVCSCGCAHEGRPADAIFTGCGATWNQRMRGHEGDPWSGSGWSLEPATPAEVQWAEHSKELSAPPLARIRASANQWRNGVTGLTAVLTAVAILGGSATGSVKWHPWNAAIILGLSTVGFLCLLVGTFNALRASIGVAGYDHRLLSTHALRRYERKRAHEAIMQIRWTQILVLLGVAFIAAAGFYSFANPNWF